MAITFFGVATVPADNSAQAGPTVALTPPASMVDGDLVYVSVRYRASSGTISVGTTGGQTWTQVGSQYNTTNIRAAIFWCRFNGTWSANPDFTMGSGTNNMDAQMLVFRPTSAAYTWTMESGPNSATYTAPSTPFTVTITGRDTTAASTVSIAAWHSIDDNSWGSLSGTGWSKTSLGAQYRNNSTSDNSSSFAYNIQTSPATLANVSQNQSALGGDAGSTSLVTFAETLVSQTLTGQSATASAGSLAVSHEYLGLAGQESVTAVGAIVVDVPAGGNATASPSGASATASAGAPSLVLSQVAEPVGAGVGTAVGTTIESTASGVSGTAAAAQVGGMVALGGAPGLVEVGGVSSTAQSGALAGASTDTGIAGAAATAEVGALVGEGGGIVHATGQPPSRFATAEAGAIGVAMQMPIASVQAVATADDLLSASVLEEIDGSQGSASVGAMSVGSGGSVPGVVSTTAVGALAGVATSIGLPAGVESIATVGNLVGTTSGAGSTAAEGVSSPAEVGAVQIGLTQVITVAGVESPAAAGAIAVEGGDSVSDEAFPSGVSATTQVGAISTGEAATTAVAVVAATQVGQMAIVVRDERIDPPRRTIVPRPRRRVTVGAKRRRV